MSDLIRRRDAVSRMSDLLMVKFQGQRLPTWNDVYQAMNDIPSAEPERKKGKWIEVHGYVTPGGDPVWKCSECGKGMHVYGIEAPSYNRDYADGQWVACPNCGAEMTR